MDVKLYWNHRIEYDSEASPQVTNTRQNTNKSLVKVAYLKEIKTELQTVTFNYSKKDETKPFYGTSINYNAAIYLGKNPKYSTKKLRPDNNKR